MGQQWPRDGSRTHSWHINIINGSGWPKDLCWHNETCSVSFPAPGCACLGLCVCAAMVITLGTLAREAALPYGRGVINQN